MASSRSRKADTMDAKVHLDPYTQASPTMYGKISRAAFHVAQKSGTQSTDSRDAVPEADELWESPGHAARRLCGSASSSMNGASHKFEQVSVLSSRSC